MAAQKSNISTPTVIVIIVLAIGVIVLGLVLPLYNMGSESSPRGFVLPQGNIQEGREAFVSLGCVNCHTVQDVTFSDLERNESPLIIPLGGTKSRAVSYGQLVTSIIHPSESIEAKYENYTDASGASMMPDLTEEMKVAQMIDIVSFLLEHYDVAVPQYDITFDPYQPHIVN